MRLLVSIILISFFSCKQLSDEEKLRADLSGNWLLIYPDHHIETEAERLAYATVQDSIVTLMGLKLVQFNEDGIFRQVDSIHNMGEWTITAAHELNISGGGKGFDNFAAGFYNYKDGYMQLKQFISTGGETIKLTWKMKKLKSKSLTNSLFGKEQNSWRTKPTQPEADAQLKAKLAKMLKYYSEYFNLVTEESGFFIPVRVALPLKFYQHAVGQKPFKTDNYFSGLFYDTVQAKRAHELLGNMISSPGIEYPSRDNYVREYAEFLRLLSLEAEK